MTDVVNSIAVAIDIESMKKRPKKRIEKSVGEKKNFVKKVRDERPKLSEEERKAKILETLTKAIKMDGGKFVNFPDGQGLLLAGVEHEGHIYFMWMDGERCFNFEPVKTTYKIAREIGANMSVLNYLVEHQKNDVVDMIDSFLSANEEYKLVTEVGIKKFFPKKNGGKKFDKKR